MRERKSNSQKPSWLGRMGNVLVAAVLLTVIVGSMALVYSHLHSQTGTGSGPQSTQTTTTLTPTQPTSASTPSAQRGLTPTTGGSLSWPVGQDTYWANLRYHQLTGYWVAWKGNPYQWVAGARAAGWHVSPMPHAPSIMVLMPYVQGASGYGHVAVVEGINADGSVHTSDMNWFINGGGWNKVSYADFTAGAGVYFIWHP